MVAEDASPSTKTKKCDDERSNSPSNNSQDDESGGQAKEATKQTNDETNDHGEGSSSTTSITPTLESGPTFHVNERVLCTDSQQLGRVAAASSDDLPPLFEAVVRKSGLKLVDSTGKIMPERKKSRRRSGQHHHQVDARSNDNGDNGITKEWCHLIHFQGWNSRWDVWLTEKDVFRDAPENRARVGATAGKVARAPAKPKEEDKKKNKKRGRPKETNEGGGGGEDEEVYSMGGNAIFQQNLQCVTKACVLPFTLQTKLVDDKDKVTKIVYPPPSFNGSDNPFERRKKGITMLHAIPSLMNIIAVMAQYLSVKKGEDVEEFVREQERQQELEEKKQRLMKEKENSIAGGEGTNKEDSQGKASDPTEHNVKEVKEQSSSSSSNNSSKISTKAILKLKKQKRKQFALSIIALVDITLPLFLLYAEEREQFAKFMGQNDGNTAAGGDAARNSGVDGNGSEKEQVSNNSHRKRPSEVYGAEFLLRFFVKLPFILSQYDSKKVKAMERNEEDGSTAPSNHFILASEEQSREFADHISELVVFLQKHLGHFKGKYFATKVAGGASAE